MKTWRSYLILLAAAFLCSTGINGQTNKNQLIIQQVYELLQHKDANPKDIDVLTSAINWEELRDSRKANKKDHITFSAVMKNEWGRVLFDRLSFQEIEKDKVQVTGIIKGRQPTECEFISTRFKHFWSLKDGKIVRFSE